MKTNLLRIDQIARILDVSQAFAYRLIAEGKIPIIRLGRSIRITKKDLENFIEKYICNQQNHAISLEVSERDHQ